MIYGSGQEGTSFHPPLKIPMYLSGNFGEIRSDHFHSGIDIKTQGTTGHRVFAVEEGYVSRIKVQANGYGKSIYISHPSGHTSVYGHLDRYRGDIAAFVKQEQYKRQSHRVDLYLKAGTFPLEKGEFIAFSGNSGSSSGPHLHFEIRSTANQHPTNVLGYNFHIKDRLAPRFRSLFLYPLNNESHINNRAERFSSRVVMDQGIYTIPYGTTVQAWGTLGISVEVFDYLDGAHNRCGIYTLEMYVDNKLSYKHVMDEFAFSESRYINAHIDYEERISSSIKAHRLHRLPNDRLRIYSKTADNKALEIKESGDHSIRIVATDVAGNKSTLEFTLKGSENAMPSSKEESGNTHMNYESANSFTEGPVQVEIPANALYRDLDFSFDSSPPSMGTITPFYHIATEKVPVHLPYTLKIKSPDVDASLRKRLLLVSYNGNGKLSPAGGMYQDGAVVAKLRNFGSFAVALDTIAPEIIPRGNRSMDFSGKKEMRFTIRDELSGIAKYEGYIDNHWALFEYDPKNDLLIYSFDEQHITPDAEHELELYVSDENGNVNLYHTRFTWEAGCHEK